MGIGLKKSYRSSSSYHPHTVAHLCNQLNHVFAVLFSISHFAKNNFYQTRPKIKLLLQKNCKIFKGNSFQWFPVARGSALNPKAQPPHYKFLALLHLFAASFRQRGRIGKGVVFTTTLIEWSGFNPHSGHVVASLDKTLYDDYLCLVASNKQQIQWTRTRRNPKEHWIIGNS